MSTTNWQVNLNDPLKRVEDADDIAQCIYIILTTIPGTDPLRPDFGSNVHQYIDKPINDALPMLIYEATTAIEKWEKRIKVTKCILNIKDIDKRELTIEAEAINSAESITINVNI